MIYKLSQLIKRMKYDEQNINEEIVHLGQLKLFLSEVLFLSKTLKIKKKYKVLYVGASSGEHIQLLAKLFPDYMFELYDPRDFAVKETNNIKIFQQFFTDEDALKYKEEADNLLFICDMRTLDIGNAKRHKDIKKRIFEMDKIIMDDLNFMKKWILIMRPYRSFIKFRLPYSKGTTRYFKGIVYLQQYAPASTECRLYINDPDQFTEYDNEEVDEKMMYFNNVIRKESFNEYRDVLKELGLVNNWDSTMMAYIMEYYIGKTGVDIDLKTMVKEVIDFHKGLNDKKYKKIFL